MKLEQIQESFSQALDSAKWTIENITAANGRGVMQPPQYGQCNLKSPTTLDASNSSLSAKFTATTLPPGVQALVAQMELSVEGVNDPNRFGLEKVHIQIYSAPDQSGEKISLGHNDWNAPAPTYVSLPYNRTQHAYVRMRFAGTLVYLDTSPDGKVWTSRGSIAHRLNNMNVKANVNYFHGEQQPAYVDDINIVPATGAFFQLFG